MGTYAFEGVQIVISSKTVLVVHPNSRKFCQKVSGTMKQ